MCERILFLQMASRADRAAARAQHDFLAGQQVLQNVQGRAGHGQGGTGRGTGGQGSRGGDGRQGRGGRGSMADQLRVALERIDTLQEENRRALRKLTVTEKALATKTVALQKSSSNKRKKAESPPVPLPANRKSPRARSVSRSVSQMEDEEDEDEEDWVEEEEDEEGLITTVSSKVANNVVQKGTKAGNLIQDLLGSLNAQTSSTQASLRSAEMDGTVAENISKEGKGRLQSGKKGAYQLFINRKNVWVATTALEFYAFIACATSVALSVFAPLQHHFNGPELSAKVLEASSGPAPEACAEREEIIGADMTCLHKALRNAVYALDSAYKLVDAYLKEWLAAADRTAAWVTLSNWGQSDRGLPFTTDLIKSTGVYFLGAMECFVLKMSIQVLSEESIVEAIELIPDLDANSSTLLETKKMLDAQYYQASSSTSLIGGRTSSVATAKKALKAAKKANLKKGTTATAAQGAPSKPAAGGRKVVAQTGSTRTDGKYCLDFMTATGCTRAKCNFSHVVPVPAAHQPLVKALFEKNPARVPRPEFSF